MITIVVPCFNQAEYLDTALESVLNQTFKDWECIIVNDGSPDNTEEIAKTWVQKDDRFKYRYQSNAGLSSARNYGIKYANGEFILPLDADDYISNEYLDKAIMEFKKNSNLKLVYCGAEKFGEESGIWKLGEFSLHNLSRTNVIFCSAIFRKSDWEKIGGYDLNLTDGWEDWDFWISLLKNGGEVIKLDFIGFFYRIKHNSMIQGFNAIKRKNMREYLSIKHADFFVEHYGSFQYLEEKLVEAKKDYKDKLKSEKFLFKRLFMRLFHFDSL